MFFKSRYIKFKSIWRFNCAIITSWASNREQTLEKLQRKTLENIYSCSSQNTIFLGYKNSHCTCIIMSFTNLYFLQKIYFLFKNKSSCRALSENGWTDDFGQWPLFISIFWFHIRINKSSEQTKKLWRKKTYINQPHTALSLCMYECTNYFLRKKKIPFLTVERGKKNRITKKITCDIRRLELKWRIAY